ncbi:MAG: hypothetical protein H6745_17700 [Deltaproteobacteria bacterium]|nr:hypothetical protein [Planctomycetota bacterium]MCB9734426.1 hypothetical protein [Deltaproteobacteria bacterium]
MNRVIAALIVLGAVAPAAHAETDPLVQAKRLLAKYDTAEPTVLEVQRAASSYAQVNPEAYEGWSSQAHLAYLLPKTLDGRLQSTSTDATDVRTTNSGAGTLSDLVSNDDQLRLEVRAQWDLTRLIYNKDAISAVRQAERLVNQREDILTTVNKLFYARRQLQVEMDLEPPTNVQKALRTQLRIDGLTADLDALTGGWFSREIERRKTGE